MRELRPLRFDLRTLAGATLAALSPGFALAGPSGEQLVGGSATVGRPDALTTVVTQQTQRAIINWQTFNVAGNELVLFQQPSSSSVVLNRVIGGSPSEIFGSIEANGRVFLLNTNGVVFAPGAQLDVGGLVASTFTIADNAFMAGSNTLVRGAGAPDAGVVNRGVIRTADGGFVVLAGDFAHNEGVIAAANGTIVLAAGARVALNLDGAGLVDFAVDEATLSAAAGVSNTGQLLADGGTVVMTARIANALVGTAVNNEGLVRATRIEDRGGEVWLTGFGGDVVNSGTLDASGVDGAGGRAVVYSDHDVTLTGTVRADGAADGAGGEVRAIAAGALLLDDGALVSARGGANTIGSGGFIEVSGHGTIHLRGAIDVGTGGAILIDPSSVTLTAGSAAPIAIGVITVGFISNQLDLGNDVKIIASNYIGASTNGLSIVSTNAAGDLMLEIGATAPACEISGNPGFCLSPPAFPVVTLVPGGTIALSGVDITIAGNLHVDALNGFVQLGNVTAGAMDLGGSLAPLWTLDAQKLIATTGNITVHAQHGINVVTSIAATNGNVAMVAASFGGSSAGVTAGTITAGGAIDIGVKAASGAAHFTVSGVVTAGAAISIDAEGGFGRGAVFIGSDLTAVGAITVGARDLAGASPGTEVFVGGNVSGQTVEVIATSTTAGGEVTVGGDVIATGGGVLLAAQGAGGGAGASMQAGLLNMLGTVTATANVIMQASDAGGGGGGVITALAISGADVTLSAFGSGAGSGNGGGQILIGAASNPIVKAGFAGGSGSGAQALASGSAFIGGDITATGNLNITAHGDNPNGGMVVAGTTTVGGTITIDAAGAASGARVWFGTLVGSLAAASISPAPVTATGTISITGSGGLSVAGNFSAPEIDLITDSGFDATGFFDTPALLLDGVAGVTLFDVVANANAITIDGAQSVAIDNLAQVGATTLTLVGTSPSNLLDVQSGGSLTLVGGFNGGALYLSAAGINLGTGNHTAANQMVLLSSVGLTADGMLVTPSLFVEVDPASALDLTTNASNVTVYAAGDVDLTLTNTGTTTLNFGSSGVLADAKGDGGEGGNRQLPAASQVGFGDVFIEAAGGVFLNSSLLAQTLELHALGDIKAGGSIVTINVEALLLETPGSILLALNPITLGTGTGTLGVSDGLLLNALAFAGLAPSQNVSNGAFLAGTTLALGPVTSAGDYLVLQGDTLQLNGLITGPTNLVVQIAPATPGQTIMIEQGGTTPIAGTTLYSASSHFNQIDAATLVIGSSTYTGPMLIGDITSGVDVTPANFIVATTGTVTGLGLVTTTGLVTTLADLLATVVTESTPPAIVSEIDPSVANPDDPVDTEAGQEDEDDEEGEDTDLEGDGSWDDSSGLVTQESAAPAAVCGR